MAGNTAKELLPDNCGGCNDFKGSGRSEQWGGEMGRCGKISGHHPSAKHRPVEGCGGTRKTEEPKGK